MLLTGLQCPTVTVPFITQTGGGVLASTDGGQTWASRSVINATDKPASLESEDILQLVADPRQPSTLYAATRTSGLYKTTDQAKTWSRITTPGQIQAFAIDPGNSSHLVSARLHQIFSSADAGKSWHLVYTESNGQAIMDLAFTQNGQSVVAAVATGELIASHDAGKSWSLIKKFDSGLLRILTNPGAPSTFFAVTTGQGLLRSVDNGATWIPLTDKYKTYTTGVQIYDILWHPKAPNSLLLAMPAGLLRSDDGGTTWTKLPLLTAQNLRILSLGWHPTNTSIIYYTTATLFHKSTDGGRTWSDTPLPIQQPAKHIAIDPANGDIIFLASDQL